MNLKIVIASILVVVLVGSVSARLIIGEQEKPEERAAVTGSKIPGSASGLVAGSPTSTDKTTTEKVEEESGDGFIVDSLPFFTEASFFGLIGFALGYFSRKVVKLMLIFLALGFIGIQLLNYGGVIEVHWSKLIDLLNAAILNLKENDSIGAILKDRIPTAGALVTGYFLGFRKG